MPRDRAEYNQRYYHENRERLIQKMKEYYQKNPEKKKAYMKAYLKSPAGRKKRRKYARKYYKGPGIKEKDRERKKKLKEWYRKYHLEYYHKNKERINAQRHRRAVLRKKGGEIA